MPQETKKVIFTDHAVERLNLRRISHEMVVTTILNPERSEREADGDIEFVKTVSERRVHVIAFSQEGGREWVVKTAWVRGEDDPLPLWRRVLRWLFSPFARPEKRRSHR